MKFLKKNRKSIIIGLIILLFVFNIAFFSFFGEDYHDEELLEGELESLSVKCQECNEDIDCKDNIDGNLYCHNRCCSECDADYDCVEQDKGEKCEWVTGMCV